MQQRFFFFLPVLLVGVLVAAFAAGCGSGDSAAKLEDGDIATVGDTHITKARFDSLMKQAKINLENGGQTFPKAGTTEYAGLRSQAVTLLVLEAEREAAAEDLGIEVTAKDVQERFDAMIKAQPPDGFGGSMANYRAALKKQGLADSDVRSYLRAQVIAQKLLDKLTKDLKVPNAEILEYYSQNLSNYQTPASRNVRYILVGKNKASLADSLFKQLQSAPDSTWCTLAKKHSQDPGSKANCGKPDAPFTKGQTVAGFDKLLFSLPTNKLGKVNTPEFGWFVIKPIGAVKPGKTTPVKKASDQITAQLLAEKKNAFMLEWVDNLQKSYCKGKVSYRVGFEPNPDPCTLPDSTSSSTTSTTTPSPAPPTP